MSGWRHVESDFDRPGSGASYGSCRCGCQASRITPDPASPCGHPARTGPCAIRRPLHNGLPHPHVPTRCTCGHPIEAQA